MKITFDIDNVQFEGLRTAIDALRTHALMRAMHVMTGPQSRAWHNKANGFEAMVALMDAQKKEQGK
jgi:hypothetical protein